MLALRGTAEGSSPGTEPVALGFQVKPVLVSAPSRRCTVGLASPAAVANSPSASPARSLAARARKIAATRSTVLTALSCTGFPSLRTGV